MLYAAKCYWPGITPDEFERTALPQLTGRELSSDDGAARHLGSIVFAADELVLCLFESSSPRDVRRVTERARIPAERIMESIWYPARPRHDANAIHGRGSRPLRRST